MNPPGSNYDSAVKRHRYVTVSDHISPSCSQYDRDNWNARFNESSSSKVLCIPLHFERASLTLHNSTLIISIYIIKPKYPSTQLTIRMETFVSSNYQQSFWDASFSPEAAYKGM